MPVLKALPVSQETRLAYVLQHFWRAYVAVPAVTIGYAHTQPAIVLADGAGSFFQQAAPHPDAPNYRDWAGQRIPFFFDEQARKPLLELKAGEAIINADLISAAFYLLSGWQEYYSEARDRHGRFPYAASVQKQFGFVTLPVVNYYFDVLKTAVEHVTGQPLPGRRWGGAAFASFITHDVDNLRSAWKAPAKAALKQGRARRFGQQLWQHLARPDAWDNLEAVAETVASYGAKSTFFILPTQRPGPDGTPNADYPLTARLWRRFRALAARGSELALHGSIGTATDLARLGAERDDAMAVEVAGNRFHYLRWEPRTTPQALDRLAFQYDSTLGFAEHFGFRHSYCLPFYPFNFEHGRAHTFLEIPLNVMDATLHHPNYLQLRPEALMPALRPMLAEIERFGGVATVLWHNENFDPANTANGPQQFAEIMTYLQQRGAAFLTGRQIVAEL